MNSKKIAPAIFIRHATIKSSGTKAMAGGIEEFIKSPNPTRYKSQCIFSSEELKNNNRVMLESLEVPPARNKSIDAPPCAIETNKTMEHLKKKSLLTPTIKKVM